MNIEEEIKKFIKENLVIKASASGHEFNSVNIELYIQGEKFSDCFVYIPEDGGSL